LHKYVFEPKSPLFGFMQKIMRWIDSSPSFFKIFHHIEYCSKVALYRCKDCGDCALFDIAYLCPVSQCPKDQRNGPCGGSYNGWCEVYPGKQHCIWVQAYDRLKTQGKADEIGKYIIPPCNWALWQTSSWVNYFLGRDHSNKKFEV
jgi:methylenetetrahydrofolate reductase (NADPH)